MNKKAWTAVMTALLIGIITGWLVVAPLLESPPDMWVIEKMIEARDTHQAWSDWYDDWPERHPGEIIPDEYALVGDQEHHDEWVEVYDRAIVSLSDEGGITWSQFKNWNYLPAYYSELVSHRLRRIGLTRY